MYASKSCQLCRHIKTNGRTCRSPALRTSAYCCHHQRQWRTRLASTTAGPGYSTHVLHSLRNANSVQQALAMVVSGLAAKRIHPKVAGKMLYALQLAVSQCQESD